MTFDFKSMLNRKVTLLVPGISPIDIKVRELGDTFLKGTYSDGEEVSILLSAIVAFWFPPPPRPRKSKSKTSAPSDMPDDCTTAPNPGTSHVRGRIIPKHTQD